MRCCNHDTNELPTELAGSKSGNETNTGQDRVEDIAGTISNVPMAAGLRHSGEMGWKVVQKVGDIRFSTKLQKLN